VADPPLADRAPVADGAPVGEWVEGINQAGWEFHRTLVGNAVSSPVSIGTAFSLARAGASPDSAEALDSIFGFPASGTHDAANAAEQSIGSATVDPNTVEIANRLFPDDGFEPLQPFLDVAAGNYGAAVQTIDTARPDQAADAINQWVSDQTRELIPTIVDPGFVQGQQLILVNTVYLKADWAEPFLPELTSDRPFAAPSGDVVVPFMHDRIPVERAFARLDGGVAVELPYLNGDLAMWLFVPDALDGLDDLEAGLDANSIGTLITGAERGTVEITMPKWEHELPPTDLFSWLCPAGFCPGAGFDGISPGLFISAALHGAKIIVDEKGTEAAAATAAGFATSAPPPPDVTLIADRPFLWTIVHRDTGALLFVGRVVDPSVT
jgi:serpin B